MSLLNIFNVAGSAMNAQSMRLNVVASNLANAESVASSTGQPYRARQVVFNAFAVNPASPDAQGVRVAGVVEDPAPGRRVYQPGHPAADADGYVEYPNVNPVEEMVNMISASRSYQDNVEAMNTARTLMLRTLSLGN